VTPGSGDAGPLSVTMVLLQVNGPLLLAVTLPSFDEAKTCFPIREEIRMKVIKGDFI
jgi:hypothetical protein